MAAALVVAVLAVTVQAVPVVGDGSTPEWQLLGIAPWHPRANAAATVSMEGSNGTLAITLLGGTNEQGSPAYNDVWTLSNNNSNTALALASSLSTAGPTTAATLEWHRLQAHAPWKGRLLFASVASSGRTFVLGGTTSNLGGVSLNDMWVLAPAPASNWTLVAATAPWCTRYGHAAVAMPDDSIVLMGGVAGDGRMQSLNDVWRWDSATGWQQMTAKAEWQTRSQFGAVALSDGTVVIMGGAGDVRADAWYNDTWKSSDGGATWTQLIPHHALPWSARWAFPAVVTPSDNVLLLGGFDGVSTVFNDVWLLAGVTASAAAPTLTRLTAAAPWAPRAWFPAVVLSSQVLLMGGSNAKQWEPSAFYNDVWSMDITSL